MIRRYDSSRKVATTYKVGDLMLWRSGATKMAGTGVGGMLANKFDGPYRICQEMTNDQYAIEAIKGVRGYKRFKAVAAVDSLRRYHAVNEVDYESEDECGSESNSCESE